MLREHQEEAEHAGHDRACEGPVRKRQRVRFGNGDLQPAVSDRFVILLRCKLNHVRAVVYCRCSRDALEGFVEKSASSAANFEQIVSWTQRKNVQYGEKIRPVVSRILVDIARHCARWSTRASVRDPIA